MVERDISICSNLEQYIEDTSRGVVKTKNFTKNFTSHINVHALNAGERTTIHN